jgi:hypothetical protein
MSDMQITVGPNTESSKLAAFLTTYAADEQRYTLRAQKDVSRDARGKETVSYVLFKRDGKEAWYEKLFNWVFRERQRKAAREALQCGFPQLAHVDVRFHKQFQEALNAMQRLVPGPQLDDVLRMRELSFDAPPEREAVLSPQAPTPGFDAGSPATQTASDAVPTDVPYSADSATSAIDSSAPSSLVPMTSPAARKGSAPDAQTTKPRRIPLVDILGCLPLFGRKRDREAEAASAASAYRFAGAAVQLRPRKTKTAREREAALRLRESSPEPVGKHIPKPASSIADIDVRLMNNVDVGDLHPSVAVAMRNNIEYFNMTERCQAWLTKRLGRLPFAREGGATGSFARVEVDGNVAYLAPHRQSVSRNDIDALAHLYKEIIDDALSDGRPLVLTPLFDYDDASIDLLLSAMLSPLYAHLRAGRAVQVEIRTACPRIAAALQRYRLRFPSSPLPMTGNAAPQLLSSLTQDHLAVDGMIMVTAETLRHAAEPAKAALNGALRRFTGTPGAEKIQVRKALEKGAKRRWYVFAGERKAKPLHDIQAIGRDIEACYREAFIAADKKRCRMLTVPVLASRYGELLAPRAAAIQTFGIIDKLRREYPQLRVCVLSDDAYVGRQFSVLESPL